MTQFNIKAGDDVAVFTYWAKLPKRAKVTLVTPTGKIRVEGHEEYLLTPKACYQDGMPWTAQTNRERWSVNFYPWTESHTKRVQDAQQERENNVKVQAIKAKVDRLHHTQHDLIAALCELLGVE